MVNCLYLFNVVVFGEGYKYVVVLFIFDWDVFMIWGKRYGKVDVSYVEFIVDLCVCCSI